MGLTKEQIKKMAYREASAALRKDADNMDLEGELSEEDEEAVRAYLRKIAFDLELKGKE